MIRAIITKVRELRFRRSVSNLVARGMKIGRGVHIMPGARFDDAYASLISIGDNCTIADGVKILAHDASIYRDLGLARLGRVEIKSNSFIAVNVNILPGVTIGPNSIVGAGSVVTRDIPPDSVAFGNPAKVVAAKKDYLEKHLKRGADSPIFRYEDVFSKASPGPLGTEMFKNAYLAGGEKRTNLEWLDVKRKKCPIKREH
ncbi:MAG: acyltransferase [Candidatus Omnitrophica bacterium]|nr:acyltransferase [Candidatus Omnitrophota bacterium]